MANHQMAFLGAILDTAFSSCGSIRWGLLRHYFASHPYTCTHAGDEGGGGRIPPNTDLHSHGDTYAADVDEDAHFRAGYADGNRPTDINSYSNSYAYADPYQDARTLSHAPAHSGFA